MMIATAGVLGPHADLLPEYDEVPCCYGSAAQGPTHCTCWVPVYDLEQQPLQAETDPVVREKCCGDCAYRHGSPEEADGGRDDLVSLAESGSRPFWCHQGVRRVIAWRHPDGRELPAGEGDYRPPVGPDEAPKVWKADGSVGEICAGWAALNRKTTMTGAR